MQKRNKAGKIIRKSKKKDKREKIVFECEPCNQHKDSKCNIYACPKIKWRNNKNCPCASHLIARLKEGESIKKRVGQQKQKKEG